MTAVTLDLPEALARDVERLASCSGVSVAQFIMQAAAEKAGAADESARYFAARAARAEPGSALRFFRDEAGNEPPRPGDEID